MPGLLFFQQVADFGQQLYVGGWSRRSRGRFGLFFPVESVDQFDEQEDCKSDDDEVESRLKKIPVVNRHGRMTSPDAAVWACLSVMPRSVKLTPPTNTPIGGMMTSATSEETILPKAAPITTPTARSITLAPHGELLEFVYEFAFHNTRF